MGARLRGWRALSWSDRGYLLLMLFGLPLVAGMVRGLGYIKTRRWLERLAPVSHARVATPGDLAAAQRLAQLAAIAGRHVPVVNATCLRQSLLVYAWLRRRGLAPELKLGIRRQDTVMDAHAWVELEGQALAPVEIIHLPFPTHHAS